MKAPGNPFDIAGVPHGAPHVTTGPRCQSWCNDSGSAAFNPNSWAGCLVARAINPYEEASIEWVPVCFTCADGWYDGADFTGPVIALARWNEQAEAYEV